MTQVEDRDRLFRGAARRSPPRRRRTRPRSPTGGPTSTRSRTPSVTAGSPTTSKMSSARPGAGIGSAGLPTYTVLIEGFNQALDNDVVLSMKQGNIAAPSRVVEDTSMCTSTSSTTGTARRSHSARSKHTPTRCSATPRWTETVTSSVELSSYESDLDWSELTEPDELDGGNGAARAGGRQGALRERRRQRPDVGRLPNRGGHR